MANMTFKASLLPNTDLGYSLGSEDKRWKINNAFVLPVYYSNIDYSNTAPIAGAYTLNAQTHPVTETIEYGSALSLPGTANGTAHYAAQLIISSASGQNSPVHAYIRRLTDTPLWSNWSTLLDNNNYTTYADTRYLKLSGGTLTGSLGFKTSSADSPDLVWYYGNTSAEQARIWMGSGGTSKWGPYYRCYNSEGTQLYTGNLVLGDGTGASGTWGISITGNAATATKCGDGSCYGYFHHSNELNFGGSNNSTTIYFGYRAMDSRAIPTNFIFGSSTGTATIQCSSIYLGSGTTYSVSSSGLVCAGSSRINPSQGALYLGNSGNQSWVYVQDICSQTSKDNWKITQDGVGTFKTCKGAVWNDYAEMRNVPEAQNNIEFNINKKGIEESRTYPQAGRCVKEKGNGEMQLSTKRLEYGCKIISDTFGFCIGETDNCKTPIAVTGRVLAYPYEDIEILKQHIGEPVCSGPNGTISLMTHEEEKEWPSKILGIISEIPNYNIWHCGVEGKESIKVNGRIWIYVR